MATVEEGGLASRFEGRPVAADDSVVGYDGLEDAAVVVGAVTVFRRQHDVTGLVGN